MPKSDFRTETELREEKERMKKYMKMPKILGEDNLQRLKSQKQELDKYRVEIEKQEKDKAMIQMRTDVLKAEYIKLFDLKEGFKTEVTDVKKKNIRIQRKIDEVEIAIEGMLEVLDADAGKKRDPLKVMNPKMRQKLMADKKKRERELLQKKMAAGVDFLGDNDVKFSNRGGEVSFFENLSAKIKDVVDNLKPFRKEVREI